MAKHNNKQNPSKAPSKTESKKDDNKSGNISPLHSPQGSKHAVRDLKRFSDVSQGPGILEMVGGDREEEDLEKLGGRSSSIIKFYPDWCKNCCNCLNINRDEKDLTACDHLKDFFSCPPKGALVLIIIMILMIALLWALLFFIFAPNTETAKNNWEPDHTKNPAWIQGPIFALGTILVSGLISGVLMKRFLNLPPLLAPLVLGIIINNVQPINVFKYLMSNETRQCVPKCNRQAVHELNLWVKPIRVIALAIILTRAGLELSPKQLKKLSGIVPLLAFGPCVVEALACAATTYVFFNVLVTSEVAKMSLAMCFVGGFALAAVSPAVVVPGALSLKKSGYGVVKGVPTLLIAASSIDDVLAISAYSISLGIAIRDKGTKVWQTYSGGAIGILVGLTHGVLLGIMLHFIPARSTRNKALHRMLLVLCINIVSVMVYEDTFFSSAGSISVLTTSFIAGFGWRSQPHWKRPMKKIEKWLAMIWTLWVPLLFGTIGKEMNFDDDGLKGANLLKTLAIIGISLVLRLTTAFLIAFFGTSFEFKEAIFVALAWIPKATVQAALAPLVLTNADEADDPNPEVLKNLRKHAHTVVNVAILAVLITAPIGSVMMALMGPKLLRLNAEPDIINEVEMEFPNGGGIDPAESTYGLLEQEKKKSAEVDNHPSENIWTISPNMDNKSTP